MGKIAVILPDLRCGGAEQVSVVLAEEFKALGHEVEFVVLQAKGVLLTEVEMAFSVRCLNSVRLRYAVVKLVRYLQTQSPDAVLVSMWPLTGIACLAAFLSHFRGRLVASEHTDFYQARSISMIERVMLYCFGQIVYGACHKVVAVSQGVADSVCAVANMPRDKIDVVPNPIRLKAPEPLKFREEKLLAAWLNGDTRLIAVGALKPAKGYEVLLHAFARLSKHRSGKLLILGEGPLRGSLETLANDLGLTNNVWMPGFKANPATFLSYAHVFILSSHWEGFGNVIVEALSCGIPVVSTDCRSGPAEILAAGRYGRLVPVGNAMALAEAIESALEMSFDPSDLKARAKEFSPDKAAKAYLDLLVQS